MYSLGLIIGRFQPLHKGHLLLIEKSLSEDPATLVLIGSVNKQDDSNPYDYELRKSMIKGEFPESSASIGALPDFPDDEQWRDCILSYIPENVSQITLYCGDMKNDSAVSSLQTLEDTLPFSIKIKEIPRSIIPVSATQIREWIILGNTEKLQEYMGDKTLEKIL